VPYTRIKGGGKVSRKTIKVSGRIRVRINWKGKVKGEEIN